ncbi:MAG: methyltransferase domain-containing protein [Verrucomicrobiales bacterium]|nr:methyltransferase domain-containing protein [Verrucomicrobiales bacterium]
MAHHGSFLRAFFRNAGSVGAVAPSSEALANLMVDWLDWDEINSVLEFGPGTGVFTEAIAKRISHETKLIAIERDEELAEITRNRCPDVTVRQACVSDAASICREEGIESVDAILCGLPWAAFPEELQNTLLDAMFEVLPRGGKFATFAYWQGLALPAGQRFRRILREHFSEVKQSPTAWKNLPPAFVYRCVR